MRKLDLLLGVLLVAVVFSTWLPRLAGPIDLRWDGGVYYVLGTSMAQGTGYRLLNEPGEIRAMQYPPLYPAIIALHQVVSGTDDPTVVGRRLRVTSLILSLLFAVACFALLRGHAPSLWALAGALLVMLHTWTVFLSDLAYAELPFTLCTVLFFLVVRRTSARSHEILAGVLVSLVYLLRTIGIALVVAWVADALLRRQLRLAAFRLLLVLPAVTAWQIYTAGVEREAASAEASYAYQRADYQFSNVSYGRNVMLRSWPHPDSGKLSRSAFAGRIAKNAVRAPLRLGETVTTGRENWHALIARTAEFPVIGTLPQRQLLKLGLYLLGYLVLMGSVVQLLRREWLMPTYVLLYIAAVCVTPWTFSGRYWIPLAPLLFLGFYHGSRALATGVGRRWPRFLSRRVMPALAAIAVLAVSLQAANLLVFFRDRHQPVSYIDRRGETLSYRLFLYRETYRALDAALDALRGEAPPDAIVAASMPHWVHLRTGLKSVKPPFERDPATALDLLETVPVAYVVVDGRSGSFTRVYGLPAIAHAPERWASAFSDTAGEVETFRRLPAPARTDLASAEPAMAAPAAMEAEPPRAADSVPRRSARARRR